MKNENFQVLYLKTRKLYVKKPYTDFTPKSKLAKKGGFFCPINLIFLDRILDALKFTVLKGFFDQMFSMGCTSTIKRGIFFLPKKFIFWTYFDALYLLTYDLFFKKMNSGRKVMTFAFI